MNLFCKIKSDFRPVISYLYRILEQFKWRIAILYSPMPKGINVGDVKEGYSLIIAPHADDELIGCYHYIKKHPQSVVLYCGLLGNHPGEENELRRKKEFISFCTSNRIQFILCEGELNQKIDSVIKEYKPSNIVIPSFIDWHPEHRLVNTILYHLDSVPDDSNIIWYRVSVPLMRYNYVIKENKEEYNNKWCNFSRHYKSQLSINFRRFKFFEKFSINGCYASEIFLIQDYNQFKKSVDDLSSHITTMMGLKSRINDIGSLSSLSESLYAKLSS